jgi:hypothetical protein
MLFLLWVGEGVCKGGQEVFDEEIGDKGLRLTLVWVCEVYAGSVRFRVKGMATGNANERRTSAPAVTIFRTASDVRALRSPIAKLDRIPLMERI